MMTSGDAPQMPINDYYYQYDHLSKPFNFLDLNNKMKSESSHDPATIMRPKMLNENWYQTRIKSGHSDRSSSVNGDDTDSNSSCPKTHNNNNSINVSHCDEEKHSPEHHARRPMNAFLIFCKRHRNIVRERYSNLENRAITKILGDWWANLSEEEKSCYTSLAKEYKDAFFSANPDFKWYKLPAPPLRSYGYKRSSSVNDSSDCDTLNRTTVNIGEQNRGKLSSDMATFKLADECHMGGLNSLMVAVDIVQSVMNNNNNYKFNADQSTEDEADCHTNKNELHRVLGETGTYLQKTMTHYSDQLDVFSSDIDTNRNIPQNRNRSKTSSGSDFDSIDHDMNGGSTASPRACKGKRYMEFMNSPRAAMINTNKRLKSRTTSISSSASLSPTQPLQSFGKRFGSNGGTGQKIDFGTFDHLYASQNITSSATVSDALSPSAGVEITMTDRHCGDVADFDLEHKINDLPARDLDEYLSRKQNTKKKKKHTDKRSTNGHRKFKKTAKSKNKPIVAATSSAVPKTMQEAKECLAMVGSQKRKARKERITRRDFQQCTAIAQSYASPDSNLFTINLPKTNGSRCATSDLLVLATMAEVTANYAA